MKNEEKVVESDTELRVATSSGVATSQTHNAAHELCKVLLRVSWVIDIHTNTKTRISNSSSKLSPTQSETLKLLDANTIMKLPRKACSSNTKYLSQSINFDDLLRWTLHNTSYRLQIV